MHAITGTTVKHNRISLNLALALKQHLHGHPCETFIADLKVHAAAANAFYYPDLLVRCQEQPLADDVRVIDDPTLIIEVLSPSTEGIDRREKLRAYRTLPSLKEYALVTQDECKLELYRRRGDIAWDIITFEPGDAVEFASVELQLPIADVYFEAGVACSG